MPTSFSMNHNFLLASSHIAGRYVTSNVNIVTFVYVIAYSIHDLFEINRVLKTRFFILN